MNFWICSIHHKTLSTSVTRLDLVKCIRFVKILRVTVSDFTYQICKVSDLQEEETLIHIDNYESHVHICFNFVMNIYFSMYGDNI